MRVWPGQPYPLGATWDPLGSAGNGEAGQSGVNFALFSENAAAVELCLFENAGDERAAYSVPLREQTDHVWHCFLPDIGPGQLYGYRVYGPYDPSHGQRFNPAKLLIDPYAKALSGVIGWSPALLGYNSVDPDDPGPDPVNDAGIVPKSVVIDPEFAWENDRAPRTPWNRTVVYECHVKGMTQVHPMVPERLRGTYLGLANDAVIEHLVALGVTAVELLPVHQSVIDKRVAAMGLTNYWGYNTIGFFAPDVRYASDGPGSQVNEFKQMVKQLHAAGLEVILDVVYNHTGEGNQLGPTLSMRGIDNRAYYRLDDDQSRYTDFTGTGNSINIHHPRTIQLIMDSLRYWVTDMHVDGFRFDLATVLARELHGIDRHSAFFDAIQQDPTLAKVKLIAEPWDIGPGGYQAGNFPMRWAEWNGKYRDTIRHFWRGDHGQIGDLASRLAGSSDVYEPSGRGPYASVNFVVAHDGFTLRDLVSYAEKHNERNGEQNQDGTDDNVSSNCGVEGETQDTATLATRYRLMRDMIATLAFSQGVPMLAHGDEMGRTQCGNNNGYAQDNELTWVSWDLDERQRRLLAFTRACFKIRHGHPSLRRRHFFRGEPTVAGGAKDVMWIRSDGREMTGDDWQNGDARSIGMLIAGDATDQVDDDGTPVVGDTLLLLLNGESAESSFTLPTIRGDGSWTKVIDTADRELRVITDNVITLSARALALLRFGEGRMPGTGARLSGEAPLAPR